MSAALTRPVNRSTGPAPVIAPAPPPPHNSSTTAIRRATTELQIDLRGMTPTTLT
jgi:hypothetical protein